MAGVGGIRGGAADWESPAVGQGAPAAGPDGAAKPVLERGARGDAVKDLQKLLCATGVKLPGGADGIFGSGTASALAQFQRAARLTPTGKADAATLKALKEAAAAARPGAGGPAKPPEPRVTAFKLSGDPELYGPKVLTATIGGKVIQLADDALFARSLAGGRLLAWSNPNGSGGYENEGEGLMVLNAATGKTRQVLSEYYAVDDVAHAQLPDGRDVLVVAMIDGGLGLPRIAVVDPTRGEVAEIDGARMKSAAGGKLEIDLIAIDDNGEEKKTGKKSLDLAKLLAQPVIVNRREP